MIFFLFLLFSFFFKITPYLSIADATNVVVAASDDLYWKSLELGIAGHDSNIIVSPYNRILGTRSRKYYYRKLIYILYLARKISPILKLGWERLVTSYPNTSHILDVALPVWTIKQVSPILSFI